jgi:ribosomal-protein-alanine N-acetyltransferase
MALVLETRRLFLREWDIKDADDLVEGLNNIEVSKWLVLAPYPYTKANAIRFINFCIDDAKRETERNSYEFAIELKEKSKVIGGVSINKINNQHGTASGGIWLNAKYHRNGYGSEAFAKRIEFAFISLDLRRLENGFLDGNTASSRMQERFGYKIEGLRRDGFKCLADGLLKNEYVTALLKSEWLPGE